VERCCLACTRRCGGVGVAAEEVASSCREAVDVSGGGGDDGGAAVPEILVNP
jgi:hypothetical protein